MDVFKVRNQLISDYASYVKSFINIRDERIHNHVEARFEEGFLWPEPLIQLNPSFEPGESIDELVENGTLHQECGRIFRRDKDPAVGSIGFSLRLHRHQAEAIKCAVTGNNYILTTGTASGKSLAYIVPIVNWVLQRGAGKGIQAIIVYPMNALANSQAGELRKFLYHGYEETQRPVRFARYTGQESDEERKQICNYPPDILITNYVMLELILTRPFEQHLIKAAQGLRFLVLDELHTYRGRQGSDVAMLVRRVRDRLSDEKMQCVGTSATVAGSGSFQQQRLEVAAVARKLFGSDIKPENVIGETLQRTTNERNFLDPAYMEELKERVLDERRIPPVDFHSFISDPLSVWIEDTFGLRREEKTGRLVRAVPKSIAGEDGAANSLSKMTGVPYERCIKVLEGHLLASYSCGRHPQTDQPPFAFRLHQFISKGGTTYSSIEEESVRYLTVYPQQFVPGDRTKVLLPLVFCRECGQEYYCVKSKKTETPASSKFEKRELSDLHREENALSGFLYFSNTDPWPRDLEAILDRLPEDWIEESPSGRRVKRNRRDHLPRAIQLGLDGTEDKNGLEGQYIPAPFRFCLRCGVSYAFRQGTDFAKLSSLSSEGRSTATTILSMSMVRSLRKEQNLNSRARKLLSFTDNRQDASLQAGHFNDFVAIGLLRAALYRAANKAGEIGLSHEELADKVFEAIDLPIQLYAQGNSSPKFQKLVETQRALRVVLAYRLYQDLKRGWRIVSQNLEQCGLIEIQYKSLYELCEAEEEWQGKHPALVSAKPATRAKVSKVLLDYMRRELAIKVDYLDRIYQDRLKQLSSQHLCEPWAIDENEELEYARTIFPNKDANRKDEPGYFYLTARGGFGQYLRRGNTFEDYLDKINLKEANIIIGQLFKALEVAGLVQVVVPPDDDKDVPGYQLAASSLLWKAADGTKSFQDPIRVPRISSEGGKTNPFFVNFYRNMGLEIQGFEAREHTAQVQADLRIKREEQFAEAKLPILYCSPTMELGVDIRELNAVNLRNIPPTPANYAQRSGRAGRSGQPALVFSYCTTGSPHDQYFFKRPTRMVAGAVSPPRMDLVNEDLVLAHLHSVWLAETGLYLGSTLKDLLDLSGDTPSLAFLPSVQAALTEPLFRQRALNRVKHILDTLELELKQSDWFNEKWAEDALDKVALSFDQACDRWRGMYRAALSQARAQSKIILDMTRTAEEKNHATRLRAEAEAQLRLLAEPQNIVDSDFNSYRYFASEGFLPGYNFPRLPLSAYIPGKRKTQDRDEFLSRPRFLAISEFGPRSVIYHEGSRYVTNRVILPVGENNELQTRKAKQCDECGYLHPIMDGDGIDKCERRQCGALLGAPMVRLFRLQNVTTKRRDRINSDEEERMRFGYELKTGVRFTEHGGRPSHRLAMIERDGQPIAKMDYGHAATIWRINLGWRRRANPAEWGFLLDIERGYWETNKLAGEEQDDQFGVRTMRVIPFVEDRRNCLLFEPAEEQSVEVMASLASALKNAIQVRYQLEDNELAAEALPSDDKRRLILFYEAAEGGAGVLRSVFDDPAAVQEVAKEALRLCHFNPETGEDLRRSQGAKEDCEAACYDCLMNYSNQRDHGHLDRQKIREMLLELAKCKVSASSAPKPRAEQLLELDRLCDSELERKWLRFLEERDLRLPSRSQILIEACHTRPDFLYDDQLTAIYVDGPPHDFPDRQQRDKLQADAMDDLGYTVIRFHHEADWELIVAQFPSVFGHLHTQGGDGGRS